MGSDAWFERFERIQAEHPEMSDEEASEAAEQKLRDDYADRADQINDERFLDKLGQEAQDESNLERQARGE
jgi:hypothetical protein